MQGIERRSESVSVVSPAWTAASCWRAGALEPTGSTSLGRRRSTGSVTRAVREVSTDAGPGAVLYVSHNGLTEPLGRRQVLPYLTILSQGGWTFTVISFEKPETAHPEAVRAVRDVLAPHGIRWVPLPYHRRPSVLATAYDATRGWVTALRAERPIALLHARSTVAAALLRWTKPMVDAPLLFDVRGLLAEEYADAAHWKRGRVLHRLTGAFENRLISGADGLVFLTNRIRSHLRDIGRTRETQPCEVIPCCVDTTVFQPSREARARIRQVLGLKDFPVVVYSGSLGSWYCLEEMLDFYRVARQHCHDLRLLILTSQTDLARQALNQRSDVAEAVFVRHVPVDDVPSYLAAADAGICFLKDSYSKRASSPTKYGEYLASGLPVVTTAWTGDAAKLTSEPTWVAIDAFSRPEYERAAATLAGLLARPEDAAAGARSLACREFSLETGASRYDGLYREMLARWHRTA